MYEWKVKRFILAKSFFILKQTIWPAIFEKKEPEYSYLIAHCASSKLVYRALEFFEVDSLGTGAKFQIFCWFSADDNISSLNWTIFIDSFNFHKLPEPHEEDIFPSKFDL